MASTCTQGIDTGFVALGYGKVAALGVLQGITELLPISSTAHMRLVPAVLGWPDPGSAFSAAMQLAAVAAVVSYFWRDVRALATNSIVAMARGQLQDPWFRLALWIVLATIPIAVAGLSASKLLNTCNSPLRGVVVIGWACVAMAILLGAAEIYARHRRTIGEARLLDAMLVGLAQVGALIPGVSRSGSTLTAALALGFKRDEAARFSFLLGLPAITLAGLKELWELYHLDLDHHAWSVLIVGLVVASISAFVAIWSLMRVLERFSSWPFVIYRFVLGLVILVGAMAGVL
ncbi:MULTISPECIES: undecaprenyl-diphosphate phosphatase [Bradyrhizobium]|jgi:undecaprenyl-diphosphatase|uniref:undecaprenyl-diphosphate phosphatase n=1 Tax=Bradyrhizobium TaxID=374 RepID=UPI0003FD6261|nr:MULTISPECIES: undecaprenyl-diphosphate phosphatase [Bradyrhizobium]KIU46021.1 UDP pyrophosphate phosphatase [Bradyrhizobium elkanii]MBK5655409.1 undecaprenyl-diphosphate phosphatase [Rhizobium sp.]OCX26940.1 undecaprenyl-diphosphatase [Bradyrhizobium sp. UASWS1016]